MTAALQFADPHLLRRHDLTVDDLVELPEDLRYELINGRLLLSPMALPIHQFIQHRTVDAIEQRCPDAFLVNGEQAVLVDRNCELRPDVVLIRSDGASRSPVLAADVPLVVEIISRSSRRSDRDDKMKSYASAAIPSYWLIDPLAARVTFAQFLLSLDGNYHEQIRTDEVVTVREPWEITLDPPAWTRKRDFLLKVARPDR